MNTLLKTKFADRQFISDYIILCTASVGSFGAVYAAIYGIATPISDCILPTYINNPKKKLLIDGINISIYMGRIPLYFALGGIVGGTCGIIAPFIIPTFAAHKLWSIAQSPVKKELEE